MYRKQYSKYQSVILLFFLLVTWAYATPIGSAGDDGYHLSSIWCETESHCNKTSDGYFVPSTVSGRSFSCYIIWIDRNTEAYNRSAKCINDELNLNVYSQSDYLNQVQNLYPNLFYKLSSLMVGNDVESSVLRIRLLWSSFFILNFLMWFRFAKNFSRIPSAILLFGSPLLLFIIPSTNPSTAVLTSAIFIPLLFQRLIEIEDIQKRFLIFLVILINATVAIGSRPDAIISLMIPFLMVIYINKISFKRNLRFYCLYTIHLVLALFVVGNISLTLRYSKAGTSSTEFGNLLNLDLWFTNLFQVPSFIAGFWGYGWGLGWKFEPPIPSLVTIALCLFCVWKFCEFLVKSPELKGIYIAGYFLMVAAILYGHQVSGVQIGQMVQPRYYYPLFLGICFVLLDDRFAERHSDRKVFATKTMIIASAVGSCLILYIQLLRVVNGIKGDLTLAISDKSWWWSNSVISPIFLMIVFIVLVFFYASSLNSYEKSKVKFDHEEI